jgi:hypothetical protein
MLFSNDHQYFIDHTMVLSLLLLSATMFFYPENTIETIHPLANLATSSCAPGSSIDVLH